MIQVKTYSDERLNDLCCYCGERGDTNDHVPSKVLLDDPFPSNLPVVSCCNECNQGFSKDEAYFACLLECVLCGTCEINGLRRDKIKRILSKTTSLHRKISEARKEIDGKVFFETESHRIQNVILKLARGHARFENSEMQWSDPSFIRIVPLPEMKPEDLDNFLSHKTQTKFPEVGSRSLQMISVNSLGDAITYWIEVQSNNYKYSVSHNEDGLTVKILIWEYLACEIIWG